MDWRICVADNALQAYYESIHIVLPYFQARIMEATASHLQEFMQTFPEFGAKWESLHVKGSPQVIAPLIVATQQPCLDCSSHVSQLYPSERHLSWEHLSENIILIQPLPGTSAAAQQPP